MTKYLCDFGNVQDEWMHLAGPDGEVLFSGPALDIDKAVVRLAKIGELLESWREKNGRLCREAK